MATINLLYQREYPINDKIKITIPTVGQIIDNEESYYNLVSLLTAMPIDLMVQLDDADIDFTTIDEYELFLLLFPGFKAQDTSLIFGSLDLNKFELGVNEVNETVVLIDEENDIIIDRAIHGQIASVFRKLHHLKKDNRKPANDDAKKYMLERARAKMKRHRNRKEESQLEALIVAMVNTEQYKYDFEGTRQLTIYQFNESVQQVIKKVDYEHKMAGIYAGTVSAKDLNPKDLNWLTHK